MGENRKKLTGKWGVMQNPEIARSTTGTDSAIRRQEEIRRNILGCGERNSEAVDISSL